MTSLQPQPSLTSYGGCSILQKSQFRPQKRGHSLNSISLPLSTQTHQKHLSLPKNPTPNKPSFLEEITNLCKTGNLTQALSHLKKDSFFESLQSKEAVGILLQACGCWKDVETGRKIHEIVSKSNQFSNDSVLNTRIVTMYSSCGCPLEARLAFDNMRTKSLYLWNAIVSGHIKNELYRDGIGMFWELIVVSEFMPDKFTFPCVIKACGSIMDPELGEVVHGMVIKMGLVSDVFVGNALVAMYGKCGCVEEAVKVFDRMPERNLVSWNSIICVFSGNGFIKECFEFLVDMFASAEGLLPDAVTMVTLLPVCASERDMDMGKEIHNLAVKLGVNDELMVNNSLVDMYLKCGCLTEAQILFSKNELKNVASWNTMIGGFAIEGEMNGALHMVREMQMHGEELKPDKVTILSLLPVCIENSQFLTLKELHGYAFRLGFQDDELVANAFVAAYTKCGALSSAGHVFNGIKRKTVSSWNALIGGYAQNGGPRKALYLSIQMMYSGLQPDSFSIGSLLLACSHLKSLQYGKEIHGFVVRNGLESDIFISISLISLYSHCGKSLSARVVFDGIKDKSLVSWNAMIACYSQNGLADEALLLFRELLSDGTKPSEIGTVSVLAACSHLSALRLGKEIHCYALKAHLTNDVYVSCSIVDMYAKSGCIKDSRTIFDGLKEKDVTSWNTMIMAYGVHGHGKEAIEMFNEMLKLGQLPDSFTFLGILTACGHSGLVDEGLKYFEQMQNFHGIEPKLEHYACVIDMLGRAKRLDDAITMVDEMPYKPDSKIWSSLLSSSRKYKALELGEKVAAKLLDVEPPKPENYVLLSNLYAGSNKWKDVQRVRQTMRDIGLRKEAGCSWIEIGGKVYSFIAGDPLLSESKDIRTTWRKLEKQICRIRYKPDTSCVLHEVDEEEKIETLKGHSEKLAVCYG